MMKKTSATHVRWLPLLLALSMFFGMVACTGNEAIGDDTTVATTDANNPPDETSVDTAPVTSPVTGTTAPVGSTETTVSEPESDINTPETTVIPETAVTPETTIIPETMAAPETETVAPVDRINVIEDPTHVTFYKSTKPPFGQVFSGANQCNVSIVQDETLGSVLKLTTISGASDPYVNFNYKTYLMGHKLKTIAADDYKYIVLTVRVENCSCESFELFYCAGAISGATGGYSATAAFDATDTGWQKVIFDLSEKDFSGGINMFRLDFLTSPSTEGNETVYIYSMDLYKTAEEAGALSIDDIVRPGEDSDLTEQAVNGVNYNKVDAPDEDASVNMWFDHMTEKLAQNDTTASDMNTYVISMAGNSIENCQFFLAPQGNRTVRVAMSDFKNADGNVLRSAILCEHYVNINGAMVPDALPTLAGDVAIKGGNSQGFVIKVWADADEPAGLYSATVDIYDAETNKHIKTANVYVNIWDFSLSDETALKSAVNISDWSVYMSYQNKGMTDMSYEDLYKTYYDFMLENRLSGYKLPYSLGDERVREYLNNPRVTSFKIDAIINGDESGAYNIMKDNASWLDKGYFYYVDEPTDMTKLNQLADAGNRLSSTFPGYNQISPFFTNIQVNADTDQIEFMKPYLDIWCTKVFAFTPRDKRLVSGTQYMTTSIQDAKYGTFAERMKALQAEGDELWLYFCWEPGQPYANWLALGDGTEPIVSIWQCKMVDATGVLYWDSTYWTSDPLNDLTPLIGASSHGDGVLMYSGAEVGSYEPISSFRLENIRLGMQDYQLLDMLEKAEGEAVVDEMVAMVTTDVITYTNDDDYLHAVRVLLGNMVSEALK